MTAPRDRAGVVRVMRDGSEWLSTDRATRLLEHMEAAGLRVVPVEATEEMERRVNAHCDTPDAELGWTWQHWLAASPFAPPQGDGT